jgi:hypothetical protein
MVNRHGHLCNVPNAKTGLADSGCLHLKLSLYALSLARRSIRRYAIFGRNASRRGMEKLELYQHTLKTTPISTLGRLDRDLDDKH